MSNVLLACGEKKIISKISKWFNEDTKENSETSLESLDNGFDIFSVSKSSQLERSGESVLFMQGWMRDHLTKTVILGQEGFKNWKKNCDNRSEENQQTYEGTYISAACSNDYISIKNDLFCLFPTIFFVEKNLFVCSDSLYIISELRKFLSLPCKPNKEVLYSRSWTHGLACSVMGNETQIKDVYLLSPGKEIFLNFRKTKDRKVLLSTNHTLKQKSLKDLFAWKKGNYNDSLREITTEFAQSIISFAQIEKVNLNFGLSGGLDSRLILAVILGNNDSRTKTKITSNTHPSRKRDLDIVDHLSKKFNFDYNNGEKIRNHIGKHDLTLSKVEDPFSLWILSSMGIFDMMYLHDAYWENPYVIDIGGHGAEIIKGTFTDVRFSDLIYKHSYIGVLKNRLKTLSKVRKSRKKVKKIKKEIGSSLLSSDINIEEPGSFQWHHMCYKSPIQNGRFLDRTLLASRPYMQKKLFSFAVSPINIHRFSDKTGHSLLQDMLIILNPELALAEFENSKYDLPPKFVEDRLFELGGVFEHNNVETYRIYGSVDDLVNGPPDLFLRKVHHCFPVSEDKLDSINQHLDIVWDKLSERHKAIYEDTYKSAKQRLVSVGAYAPNAGAPAAKIISLTLLDEM
jgi:hypothetical protein